jgi:hypothetical protein
MERYSLGVIIKLRYRQHCVIHRRNEHRIPLEAMLLIYYGFIHYHLIEPSFPGSSQPYIMISPYSRMTKITHGSGKYMFLWLLRVITTSMGTSS